jgi:hypothetical protein
MMVGIPRFL